MRLVTLGVLASAGIVLAAADPPGWAPVALAHETRPAPVTPAEPAVSTAPKLSVIGPAPDFELQSTSGRPVRLSGLRGRVVLLSFIYANCPDACPLVTQRMALLQGRLSRAGLQARAHFLSVTVDPERDSADSLAVYASRFGAVAGRWQFLTDAPSALRPVLAAYDEWTRRQPGGGIDHPARLYLIDQQGRIREIYSLSFFDERQAFEDIHALLRERG